jgi:hypothetical protein
MAIEKNIYGRIVLKHDTEENWNKATNFIPKAGEMIIYDEDSAHLYPRIKIGNGRLTVPNLNFIEEVITVDDVNEICGITTYKLEPNDYGTTMILNSFEEKANESGTTVIV